MIRINLLGIKKEMPRAAGPSVSLEGAKLTVMFLVIVGLGLGALFVHWSILQKENKRLTDQQQQEQARKDKLAGIKTEYERFEKQQQILVKQGNILEGLRKNQSGPVTLLNTVANTVVASDQVWLTSFENDGLKVAIDGVAVSVNSVADFITNLKRTGQFKTIEIKESYQDDRFKDLPTFVFSIAAELVPPPPALTGTKT